MADLNRRNFVKLGALSAASMIAMSDSPLSASALDQKGVKYDQEYDVVVIGSGYAAPDFVAGSPNFRLDDLK